MDAACPPALIMLTVTARVLALNERVAAGDLKATAEAEAIAALINASGAGL